MAGERFVRESGRLYDEAIVIEPDGGIAPLAEPGEVASIHRIQTSVGS